MVKKGKKNLQTEKEKRACLLENCPENDGNGV